MDTTPPPQRWWPRLQSASNAAAFLDILPPEILDDILSRLSLCDAVRTSALSRAWRHRWESVRSLQFTWGAPCRRVVDPGAITGVLDRYSPSCKCKVLKFNHRRITDAAFRHSDDWLRILANKGVQSLLLNFKMRSYKSPIHTLQPSIFSCRDLVNLSLLHCNIPATPPGFAGLPKLTGLYLFDVHAPARDLEFLIATSPLLEHLRLVPAPRDIMSNGKPWVIQAPKLREMHIVGGGYKVNDLPSLEVVRIMYYDDYNFINLLPLPALAATRQLKLEIRIAEHDLLEGLSQPFNNLNKLSLHITLLRVSVLSVFSLLRNAPEVKSLCIELYYDYPRIEEDEVDSEFLNAQWNEDLFSKLTSVVMRSLMFESSDMDFIEFVLSKATRLEKLTVCTEEDCPRSDEDVVIELVKFRRASPLAQVFLK